MWFLSVTGLRIKPIADVPIFLSIRLSRASVDTMFNHSRGMICHDAFWLHGQLVGQLNGNGQKGMLQIDAPQSKISGYATVSVLSAACWMWMREQWSQRRKWQWIWPAVRLFVAAAWRRRRKRLPAVVISATVECVAVGRQRWHGQCRRRRATESDRATASQAPSLSQPPPTPPRHHEQHSCPVHLGQSALILSLNSRQCISRYTYSDYFWFFCNHTGIQVTLA